MIKQLQCKRRKSIPCSAPASRCGPSQTCWVQSLAKGRRCSAQRYRKIPLALDSLEKSALSVRRVYCFLYIFHPNVTFKMCFKTSKI